jgi:hypothetical protein
LFVKSKNKTITWTHYFKKLLRVNELLADAVPQVNLISSALDTVVSIVADPGAEPRLELFRLLSQRIWATLAVALAPMVAIDIEHVYSNKV